MSHLRRSRFRLLACVPLLLASGCGGDDPDAAESELARGNDEPNREGAESNTEDDPGAFNLSIDGRDAGGQALLSVREDDNEAQLSITAAIGTDDFVNIVVSLPGEALMGEHHPALGLPLQVGNVVSASLLGEDYYSQAGQVDLTLAANGNIQGSFAAALTVALVGAEPPEATEVTTPLSGTFTGSFQLVCYSRVRGHMTWVQGGQYCADLEL